MKKRLIIIGIVLVVIGAVLILLPDSFFIKFSEVGKNSEIYSHMISESESNATLDEMFNNLNNNKYDYKYELKNVSYTYECSGTRDGDKNSGSCTSPEEVSYDESNFDTVFNRVNTKYLDSSYVYNLIKDQENEAVYYDDVRRFEYNVVSNGNDTNILVYANSNSIEKIIILNDYLTYTLEYSNVN